MAANPVRALVIQAEESPGLAFLGEASYQVRNVEK